MEVGRHALHETVVRVEHEGVGIGHFAVEAHALLQLRHFLIAAHIFALGDDDGAALLAHGRSLDVEIRLIDVRHDSLEDGSERMLRLSIHLMALIVGLLYELVDRIAIDAEEPDILIGALLLALLRLAVRAPLLLKGADEGRIELAIEEQDVVALRTRSLNVAVLGIAVVAVEANEVFMLIHLIALHGSLILLVGVALAVDVAKQGEGLGLVVEIGLAQDAIVDEKLEVVPLPLKVLTVFAEDGLQAVGHLLRDILRNLLHIAVALEIGTADVEGNVRTIDDTVEEGQEIGDDVLHAVRDEHLIAEELNLIAVNVDVALDLGEIEHAREVEGIVHIEVNPEERIILHGVEVAIEGLVVFILQGRGLLSPERGGLVDDVRLIGLLLAAVLPLRLLAEGDGNGEELAILLQEFLYAILLQKFLAVVVDVQHDVRAAPGTLRLLQGIFGITVAAPLLRGGILPTLGDDIHTLGHHEGAVESQAEMPDDGGGIVLVFLQKVGSTAEGNLIDIAFDFVGSHTDTAVADGQRAGLSIHLDLDGKILHVAHALALGSKRLELLGSIDSVGDDFAEENLVVAIEELLDDGENVLGGNTDVAFHLCHNLLIHVGLYLLVGKSGSHASRAWQPRTT